VLCGGVGDSVGMRVYCVMENSAINLLVTKEETDIKNSFFFFFLYLLGGVVSLACSNSELIGKL
jgi:hypothetical protein